MGWLAAVLAALVAPKCGLCLAGYLAAGGVVVELCGGAAHDHAAAWLADGAAALVLLVAAWWLAIRGTGLQHR